MVSIHTNCSPTRTGRQANHLCHLRIALSLVSYGGLSILICQQRPSASRDDDAHTLPRTPAASSLNISPYPPSFSPPAPPTSPACGAWCVSSPPIVPPSCKPFSKPCA